MTDKHPGFRIFVLGAGFSKLAGLPLASELYPLTLQAIEKEWGRETKFQRDIEAYIEYRKDCDGIVIDQSEIDLEELISFWDIEHYLGLRGSDTWSSEGNESQLMIRKAMGRVIQNRTPELDRLPCAYYRFAESLTENDTVITFNYDVLLERALDHIGKPYRLFPARYKKVGRYTNEVDDSKDELVILKLHGSVDWFSNKQYLESKKSLEEIGSPTTNLHTVFDERDRYGARPLVDGIRPHNDPLQNIFRIRDVDGYYLHDRGFNAPFMLSPSQVKFVYAPPLLDFWHGLNRQGGWNLGVSVVGFSLPEHDEYIRQVLYNVVSNYQGFSWDSDFLGFRKAPVKFVDFRNEEKSRVEFKERYRFSDPGKTEYWFDGFSDDSVPFIFGC
ncbi:MAG: SIR2 family protein [Oceanospirillaceae bacterium]|nr:SIR2 family protein [Oceanospirillaceae bacterium]